MDKERLKKGHMFTDEYFERQLQYIREIRLSERKFDQKVTDLYATAFDYDKDARTTRLFFQTVQNKLHYAVHRHTAAELIVERADAAKEHMGLATWENAPDGKIVKADVTVAKNYLSEKEMSYLERIVSLYLDYAELQAERKIPMSMEDWAKRLDGFLEFNGNELLTGPGKISAEQAKLHAETEFEKYRIIQDRLYESDFDRFLMLEQSAENSVMENELLLITAAQNMNGLLRLFWQRGWYQIVIPPSSLSRNPVCTQEQTGSRTYMSEKTAKRNEDNRFLHFHVANFFKFMAATLSFTQFVT